MTVAYRSLLVNDVSLYRGSRVGVVSLVYYLFDIMTGYVLSVFVYVTATSLFLNLHHAGPLAL